MNRVDRLFGYLLLLQSRDLIRAQDLAAQFEISERTVYRDIQALCEVGVPIAAMPGEGYRLMAGYYLPPISFAPDEARALSIAVSMLEGFATDGETKTAASTALDKIRNVLPSATRRQLAALQAIMRFFSFPTPPINFDDPLFLQLQQAIHEKQVVWLRYHAQHSNAVTEREVAPTSLVNLGTTWLLSGYCRLRQSERVFRLNRIDSLRVLPERFTRQTGGMGDTSRGEQEVLVRFAADQARWVRERQHFSFVGEETAVSGDVLMRYRPKERNQLANWLLSWGTAMEVVSPASLRQEIWETAVRLAQAHAQSAEEVQLLTR